MAEGVFRHQVERAGLSAKFEIDSAGTAAYHVGDGADPRTRDLLASYGIRCDSISRQVNSDDYERFDHILAMDRSNLRDMERRCPAVHRHKLSLVLTDRDVPDPYYGGPDGFDLNYRQLDEALGAWLERWRA